MSPPSKDAAGSLEIMTRDGIAGASDEEVEQDLASPRYHELSLADSEEIRRLAEIAQNESKAGRARILADVMLDLKERQARGWSGEAYEDLEVGCLWRFPGSQ